MKKIVLPVGTEYIKFEGESRIAEGDCTIGYWMARANFPDESALKKRMEFDWAIGEELLNAIRTGGLRVRHRFTKMPLLPDAPGSAVLSSVISVDDLRTYLADHGYTVEVEHATSMSRSVPTGRSEVDLEVLATREELIAAFGNFTGMDASWFNNLKDKPALLTARKRVGNGKHGKSVTPLFCPYEVMQWLIDPKRKTGRGMRQETGWRMLKAHFPCSYERFAELDPRENQPG